MSEEKNETSRQRILTGRVVSNGAEKTISVLVERKVKHPMYGKYMRKSNKYLAHDEQNECQVGDVVTIAECRPLSKRKAWRLERIVERPVGQQ